MKRISLFTTILLATAVLCIAVRAQQPLVKNHYRSIEASRFTVEESVKIPDDFVVAMMNELTKELGKSKKFEVVFLEEDQLADVPEPALKLVGVVKQFKPGSRAKRYFIGFGAGKTKVVAHVKFLDRKTGQVLYEDDVDGKVVMGVFGGNSMGAARGLAKEVAKVAKKRLFQ